jgi:hypothetical protein
LNLIKPTFTVKAEVGVKGAKEEGTDISTRQGAEKEVNG